MSIETVCKKCGEEYDARHPRCPVCPDPRPEPQTYDQKIIRCFEDACESNADGDGASPDEVTKLMHERKWLSPMDTVLDVEKIMRRLRNEEGRL